MICVECMIEHFIQGLVMVIFNSKGLLVDGKTATALTCSSLLVKWRLFKNQSGIPLTSCIHLISALFVWCVMTHVLCQPTNLLITLRKVSYAWENVKAVLKCHLRVTGLVKTQIARYTINLMDVLGSHNIRILFRTLSLSVQIMTGVSLRIKILWCTRILRM